MTTIEIIACIIGFLFGVCLTTGIFAVYITEKYHASPTVECIAYASMNGEPVCEKWEVKK